MTNSTITIAVISSCTTLAGIILTFVYNLLKEKSETKRHNRKIELEERKSRLEERKLVLEQHNQREIRVFEERLKSYPLLFRVLLKSESGLLPSLSREGALEIKKEITDCVYIQVSRCLSNESMIAVTEFRSALTQYSEGKINGEILVTVRIKFLQALHKDFRPR